MIKNFQHVEPPKVLLGNLGLQNACSYYVAKDLSSYPRARFARRGNNGGSICDWCDPAECPAGYEISEQFDSPEEALLDYAEWIRQEFSNLTDDQINHDPVFYGRKRSARWQDERRRRGLIQ